MILDYIFAKIALCCPCVTSDILFYITALHALAIMQDFPDYEKKTGYDLTKSHLCEKQFAPNIKTSHSKFDFTC